ncbi:MAG: GNAT family N-acetyltransferase [Verrucomicrobiaceae bacterium]|nr:GNAT family N-acetyltransferase [Verrucomicrobiaceae bacterium]
MNPAWKNKACPFLPETDHVVTHHEVEACGADRGPAFYEATLRYAQSLWRTGFPAKGLLLCSRAMAADLQKGEDILHRWPLPYEAVAWMLVNRKEGQFLGNPCLHFQHLASRMSGPRRELRMWRAWACWYLAKELLDPARFPGDLAQIRKENLVEPTHDEISRQLHRLSVLNDDRAWGQALRWSQSWRHAKPAGRHRVTVRQIEPQELTIVRQLAWHIWPRVYADIISEAQIRYMLERFYHLPAMWDEVEHRGVCYAFIEFDGSPSGYLSFEGLRNEKAAFLHKLYLLPECHGVGAGAMALDWVEHAAARVGLRSVKLRVNKRNAQAIRAYLRSGFKFAGDVVSDIGGGFVMDDYWMEKAVGG